MIAGAVLSLFSILECGIIYSKANIIRRIKIALQSDSDFEAQSIFDDALLNRVIYQIEKDGYCFECETKSKPEVEKKTTYTGGNGTYLPEEISFFSNGNIKEKNVKPTKNTSYEQVYNGIKTGEWKESVEKARQYSYGSTDYKRAKEKIPYIAPHGKCSVRGNDYMHQHSGAFAGDVDPSTTLHDDFYNLFRYSSLISV